MLRRALRNIYGKSFRPMTDIEINLFNEICDRINEAARKGFDESGAVDPDDDFRAAILRNNEVFAAFKVHRMQNDMAKLLLDSNGNLKPFEQWRKEVMPIASHQVGQWLRTEYNTAVIRAHQAADWQQFEREKDVLPNLRWMPSTSVNPGKDHMIFWGTVRPIDDPFWNEHRPGDRWNCKCDLSSTDDPVTPVPDFTTKDNPHPGLDNNPGKDGIIFSDSHPYFPKDCKYCSFYQPKLSDTLLRVFTGRRKNCYACKFINQGIEQSLKKERRRRNWAEYNRLKRDEQYTGVFFDKKSGGLKATHVGHITHDSPKAERFFEGLTSSDLERECQDQLVSMGHKALLCDESKKEKGNFVPALDLLIDDILMDIRSVTGHGWYSNIFVSKNDQLRRFNRRKDISEKADSLCLYFHDPALFNEEKMEKSINYFRFYRDLSGELIDRKLKHVYCVIRGRDRIIKYDII